MEKNDEDEFVRGSKPLRVLSSPLRGEYVEVCSSTGALLMLFGLVLSGEACASYRYHSSKGTQHIQVMCNRAEGRRDLLFIYFFRASRLTS